MQKGIPPPRLTKYRMVGSAVLCAVWALLSIHSWRSERDSLYFWLFLMLLAISVFIFLLDVVANQRGRRGSSEE
jgi:formate hydrogenlyase subunit 3/multisubunit Na+/H+ antiporter MnhD subunit